MLETLAALLVLNFLGMLSPGPDMMLVLRYASQQSQQAKFCVLGVLSGFAVHISFALAGLSVLIQRSPWLFEVLRYAGAGFLIFLGLKALLSKPNLEQEDSNLRANTGKGACKAWLSGLSCNLLNPKILVFVVSVFSQFVGPESMLADKLLLGAALLLQTALMWYAIVQVLTRPRVQAAMQRYQRRIDKLSGGTLLSLGALLGLRG